MSKTETNHQEKLENNNQNKKSDQLIGEVWEKVTGYLLAAFGLVAGLAWNDAIKTLITKYYTVDGASLIAQLIYALFMTLLVVVVSIIFVKLSKKNQSSE